VRLVTNPLLLRAAFVLLMAACAFALGIWTLRRLRKNLHDEADLDSTTATTLETLPLHLYNTVIQQLKQQKHELLVQTQTQQRRARTTENFSQAVLSNLPSGVLVFGPHGLVRQANPAAKEILGFASPIGMGAEDIFRGAALRLLDAAPQPATASDGTSPDRADEISVTLAEEVDAVLRQGARRRQIEADYTTPAGGRRRISVTVSPVPAVDGGLLGAACMITDLTEFERIRRQQELHNDISAEMALELRTSLATISGYAQQLARNRDPGLAQQLAADIAGEALGLERHIGGFLARKHSTEELAAHAGSP
jgi:PAS domain-containing protein